MSPAKTGVSARMAAREEIARWLARRLVVDHGRPDIAEEIYGDELPLLLVRPTPPGKAVTR